MTSNTGIGTSISNEAELLQHWDSIKAGVDFDRRTLWICFLDHDDVLIPTIVPIDEIPVDPDEEFVGNLAMVISGSISGTGVGSAVLLLSRPGLGLIGKSDRRWAAALREHLDVLDAPWPLALLTQDRPAALISLGE